MLGKAGRCSVFVSDQVDVSVVPSGRSTVTRGVTVAPVTPRVSTWPAVPLNVRGARWPARLSVSVTGDPPMAIVVGAWSSDSVNVKLPVPDVGRISTRIV